MRMVPVFNFFAYVLRNHNHQMTINQSCKLESPFDCMKASMMGHKAWARGVILTVIVQWFPLSNLTHRSTSNSSWFKGWWFCTWRCFCADDPLNFGRYAATIALHLKTIWWSPGSSHDPKDQPTEVSAAQKTQLLTLAKHHFNDILFTRKSLLLSPFLLEFTEKRAVVAKVLFLAVLLNSILHNFYQSERTTKRHRNQATGRCRLRTVAKKTWSPLHISKVLH